VYATAALQPEAIPLSIGNRLAGAVERVFVHIFTPSHYDRASLVVLHLGNLCRHAPHQVTQSNSQY